MSFASEVKEELCRGSLSKKGLARAEAYGVLLFCQVFSGTEIRIVTASVPLQARLPQLFSKAFGVSFDQQTLSKGGAKCTFALTEKEKLLAVQEAFGMQMESTLAHHINFGVLEEGAEQIAFLRGAFLAGGSVSNPEKSYHLEMVTSHFNVSRELVVLMREAGFAAKQTLRNSNYVTYFKSSVVIEDFLTTLGAPVASMAIMNAKVEKGLRVSVNRRVNCDSANLDKAVDAAISQAERIKRLAAARGLEGLPDKLHETAQLRMEYPELTLAELANLCRPPVSKSCLNHRLRKLLAMADELEK